MGGGSSKEINKTYTDIYREKVTSVLSQNSTAISNVLSTSQLLKLKVKCAGNITWQCPVTQSMYGDMKVITQVTQDNINELVSLFTADIENSNSQSMKQLVGFLGNLGDFSSVEVLNETTTRIKDIINSKVTLENLSTIVNSAKLDQEMEITIGNKDGDCSFFGPGCKFNQDLSIHFAADTVVKSIIDSVINDTTIQRIINDNKQVVDIKKKGLEDVISAIGQILTGALATFAVAGIAVLYLNKSIIPTQTLTEVAKTNPKTAVAAVIFLVLLAISTLYMIGAYIFKFWPFNEAKVFWTCEKINEMNTGKCVPASPDQKYGFTSEEECVKSGGCDQYWGCETKDERPTGKCAQFKTAVLGPERSKSHCEEKVKNGLMCAPKYGCATTPDQRYYEDPPRCVSYVDPKKGRWTSAQCAENIGLCKNSWKCVNRKCEKAPIGSGLGLYASEQECTKLCAGA